MKKFFYSLILLFSAFTASADEGMWTLYNLPEGAFRQMIPILMLYAAR